MGEIARVINTPEATAKFVLYYRYPETKEFKNKLAKPGMPTLMARYLVDDVRTPEGEAVEYKPDESLGYGLSLYEAPKRFVKKAISQRKDRYRLYDSPPLEVNERQVNGSYKHITYNPWYFTPKKVIDQDNGELIESNSEVEWHEDIGGKRYFQNQKKK